MSFKSLEKYQQGGCQLGEVMTGSEDQKKKKKYGILRERIETMSVEEEGREEKKSRTNTAMLSENVPLF